MKIPQRKLKNLLTERTLERTKKIGKVCEELGHPCYLVGGTVRDLILNLPQSDIDIVTESDITSFLTEVSKIEGLQKIQKSQFGTVKLFFEDDSHIDIARARKESYPHPASLPVVEASSIEDDIKRRDFTINTLLMGISKKDFGWVYDKLGGIDDIKRGIIRVLHSKSFIDDPTRIFRAFRFRERFSFRFERKTKALMVKAIKDDLIKRLTPQRIRRELFLLLKEKQWRKIISGLSRYGVLSELGIKSDLERKTINAYEKRIGDFAYLERDWELAKLLFITEGSKRREIETFSERIGLRKEERTLLLDLRVKSKRVLQKLYPKNITNKEIYWLLKPIMLEGIAYLYCKSTYQGRKRIMLYINNLKNIKTKISGEDLKKLGIKEGPIYNKILKMVLDKRLNGELKTKNEEIEFIKHTLGSVL